MPTSEIKELTQEDVFRYIDEERSKGHVALYNDIPQETKGGFKVILIINLISILIATGGFFVVYSIFKQKEYQLVGTEKSIRGLEDVLYKELQKKANAELANKQKEIQDIRKQLDNVNNQMADFKNKQQQILNEKMKKIQQEYQAKIKKEQSNKSAKEKAAIKKRYKLLMEQKQKELENTALQKQTEFQTRLESERKKLELAANQRNKELEKNQNALKKTQQDLEQKIKEEKLKGQQALQTVQSKLDQKEKIDAFNTQVNTAFRSAIQAYRKGDYQTSGSTLKSVLKLYQNKPEGVILSSEKKEVDQFFVSAISEYLSFKEKNTTDTLARLTSLNQAWDKMAEFNKDVQSGYFGSRPKEYQDRLTAISNLLPQSVVFAENLSSYKYKILEKQALPMIHRADTFYTSQDYLKASELYFKGMNKLASTPTEKQTLQKLKSIQSLMTPIQLENKPNSNLITLNKKEIEQQSLKTYQTALKNYKKQNWTSAEKSFTFILTNYPTSSYASKSLSHILKIHETQAKKDSSKRLIRTQTRKAYPLFTQAEKYRKNKEWTKAFEIYQRILESYPYASQGAKSLNGLIETLTSKTKMETTSLYGDYAKNLNKITNNLVLSFAESNQIILRGFKAQELERDNKLTELTNRLLFNLISSNQALMENLVKLTNKIVKKYKKQVTLAKIDTSKKIVKIGRIMESLGEDIIITPLGRANLKSGDKIKIFRKGTDNSPEYIATATVKEASEYVITAKLGEKIKVPKNGDSVYK